MTAPVNLFLIFRPSKEMWWGLSRCKMSARDQRPDKVILGERFYAETWGLCPSKQDFRLPMRGTRQRTKSQRWNALAPTSTCLPGFLSTNLSKCLRQLYFSIWDKYTHLNSPPRILEHKFVRFPSDMTNRFFAPKINVQSFVVCLRRPPERNIKGSSRRESLHLNINIKEEAFQGLENTPNLSCPCLLDMIMTW